jgi:hypothetical protein
MMPSVNVWRDAQIELFPEADGREVTVPRMHGIVLAYRMEDLSLTLKTLKNSIHFWESSVL